MNSENIFWLIIIGAILTCFTLLSYWGISTHNKNQDRLVECGKTKSAINCQCLIHSYEYCYAPEQFIK